MATDLKVRSGLRSRFDVNLDVGGVSEVVTVTASEESSVSTPESRQVIELPNQSRNYANFAALNAGVAGGGVAAADTENRLAIWFRVASQE